MTIATLKQGKFIKYIKKIGLWGFLFFLAKGLVWLAIGYFVVK